MWYNLNPLCYLLGAVVFSGIFTLFWDNAGRSFAGASCGACQSREELDMAAVRAFFAQPDVAALLERNRSYIGTAVKTPEDGGVTVTLSLYDTENARAVKSQDYRAKTLSLDLRRNFGASEMIVVA